MPTLVFFGFTDIFAIWSNSSFLRSEFWYNAFMHKNLTHSRDPMEAKSAAGNLSVAFEGKMVLKSIEPPK